MTQPPSGYRDAYGQPVETTLGTGAAYGTDADSTTEQAKAQAQGVAQDAKVEAASVAQDAKGEAAAVAEDAKQQGRAVMETAKGEAADVASHAKTELLSLLGNARGELNEQASAQQSRLADFMRTVTTEVEGILDPNNNSYQQGVVSDLAGQASTRVSALTGYLESAQPADLVSDVTRFARRRPGLFLALTAAAGVAVGRFGRGLADDARDDSDVRQVRPGTQAGQRYVADTTYVPTTGYAQTTDYVGDPRYVSDADYTTGQRAATRPVGSPYDESTPAPAFIDTPLPGEYTETETYRREGR